MNVRIYMHSNPGLSDCLIGLGCRAGVPVLADCATMAHVTARRWAPCTVIARGDRYALSQCACPLHGDGASARRKAASARWRRPWPHRAWLFAVAR
ncbi:hypothetical protein CBM2633_A50292 [Cupriavidus taiwanensis]|uniref:Uncharacterized protein n=1 Tax=Cupriavidus taiwanensis TaxID=164546 RepID=A0A375DZK2_9BURK|nr:hypothetical protein CBM2615_A120246 [Cupriavidus taiwanensis]SOZ49975.1 hypothetical protein CBM2614_A120244 [Cupriavidus taiwanensis]SOZ52158.1 hypothetical protein CBM2613_A110247 [Cupriavidus taiwanensis]SPA14406.1 hypothetical protein CBM2633_A50292 [Cupriavidus taiwanensis]